MSLTSRTEHRKLSVLRRRDRKEEREKKKKREREREKRKKKSFLSPTLNKNP